MHAPCLNAHSPKRSTAQYCGVYRGLTASAHAWPEPLEENLGCLRLRPKRSAPGKTRMPGHPRGILHCGTGICAGPSPRRAPPPQPLIAWSRERRPRRTGSGRGCHRGHARQTGIRSGPAATGSDQPVPGGTGTGGAGPAPTARIPLAVQGGGHLHRRRQWRACRPAQTSCRARLGSRLGAGCAASPPRQPRPRRPDGTAAPPAHRGTGCRRWPRCCRLPGSRRSLPRWCRFPSAGRRRSPTGCRWCRR